MADDRGSRRAIQAPRETEGRLARRRTASDRNVRRTDRNGRAILETESRSGRMLLNHHVIARRPTGSHCFSRRKIKAEECDVRLHRAQEDRLPLVGHRIAWTASGTYWNGLCEIDQCVGIATEQGASHKHHETLIRLRSE